MSQAVGRQAASAKDSSAGLGTRLAARHRHPLGQRALVLLGEDRTAARSGGSTHHRVDDDLVAVRVDPGRVAAEDHRQLVGRQPDPAQRPQVVVVERTGPHLDDGPAVAGAAGSGASPTVSPASGIVGVEAGREGGTHASDASSDTPRVRLRRRPGRLQGRRQRPSATAAATAGATRGSSGARHDARPARRSSATTVGDRVGGGDLHRLGDRGRAGVERAPEDARERQHVVDLVGEVAAPGGDDRRVARGDRRVHLGRRVGQREDRPARRHPGQRRLVDRAAGDADEDVGAAQRLGDPAGDPARVGRSRPARPCSRAGRPGRRAARRGSRQTTAPALTAGRDAASWCTATPAAPAPLTTMRRSASLRSSSNAALRSAASTTIAVPCWSSWNTGMSAPRRAGARSRSSAGPRCPRG